MYLILIALLRATSRFDKQQTRIGPKSRFLLDSNQFLVLFVPRRIEQFHSIEQSKLSIYYSKNWWELVVRTTESNVPMVKKIRNWCIRKYVYSA